MKAIILAGGSGTRLWPLSRGRFPKQFVKIEMGKPSLFQETFLRSVLVAKPEDIYVVTNFEYKFLVMGAVRELGYDYPEENILVEPEAKNTLPAIYAGVHEIAKGGDDSVVVFPSDQKIALGEDFAKVIKASEPLCDEAIITFGIKPDGPNTGYGYIEPAGEKLNGYMVNEFKEKPDLETAKSYIAKGYFWNAGIFMFNTGLFTEEIKAYAMDVFEAFNTTENMVEAFGKIERKISIDYGIMENSKRVAVVPIDVGWNDLGSFDSIYDVYDKDDNNNVVSDENIVIDSSNNYIYSEKGKLVATIGVEDLLVVDNRDALLICKKEQSQKVKEVVDILKERGDNRTQFHVRDYRPWGDYKILEEEDNKFKIKRIKVSQGSKLSYQMHYHRAETWVVVSGMAKITIDDVEQLVPAGDSVFIRAGQKHRLENPGSVELEIIEVQMGDYLEEDDIVRFNDDFGRV